MACTIVACSLLHEMGACAYPAVIVA